MAIERTTAGRIDELRGAARENLAEELNGLINANPALRFDPVLREDRWSTIIERADSTAHQQMAELRGRLDEALAEVADNATIVNNAAAGIGEQTELCGTLRAVLDARTATGVGDGDATSEVAAVAIPEPRLSTTTVESADAKLVAAGAAASPVGPVRHDQMQLVVDPPAITEGLSA